MKKTILIAVFALYVLPVLSFGQATWKMTSGEVSFKIKNAGVTVTGRFGGLKTTLKFSPDKPASSTLSGSVEVATIKTGIDKRDKDLQEEKYFNTDKYKLIEIAATKLYKKGAQYEGVFNVTIKGVTKQMTIPFEFTQQGKQADFKCGFTINRRDFGVGEKSMMMSDDLNVTIDIKANE